MLAAGRSTRLGALGAARPKPLVPICGYPAIAFGLAACARAGLRDVVINLHHHGDQIRAAVGDGSALRGAGAATRWRRTCWAPAAASPGRGRCSGPGRCW